MPVVLFRTAWISDDAAITLRTVLNVTHGFGLTFNIAERVQTYTHPLGMGLLTIGYLLSGNVYVTTFAAAMICSIVAFMAASVFLFSLAVCQGRLDDLRAPVLRFFVSHYGVRQARDGHRSR